MLDELEFTFKICFPGVVSIFTLSISIISISISISIFILIRTVELYTPVLDSYFYSISMNHGGRYGKGDVLLIFSLNSFSSAINLIDVYQQFRPTR